MCVCVCGGGVLCLPFCQGGLGICSQVPSVIVGSAPFPLSVHPSPGSAALLGGFLPSPTISIINHEEGASTDPYSGR